MKIYHGSNNIIEKPIYGYGKTYNDYGLGFYCTENIELAHEWAVSELSNGYANCYELDVTNLKILNLNNNEYNILTWLAILLKNRQFDISSPLALEAYEYIINNFLIDYENYDLIIGYRADDSYFSFAQDFINGTISYRQLNNAMHLGGLGIQVVLKSKKAFDQIKYIDAYISESSKWYNKKQFRDLNARNEYFNVERNRRQKGDIYIQNIIDEEMKTNDSRLQ